MKFLEVIKYEGPNNVLVWKHTAKDFNTSSTLIVHESQVAIFMRNGQIADVFEAGRYTLKTENIPLLRKLMNIPTGGESTFHCEVYFINQTEKMALRWGTDSKVQFIEPTYNFPMEIGASGEMSLKIKDPASFLVRLVGTEESLSAEGLTKYFRAVLMTRVKSYLARTIKEQQLNIFEIDSYLDVLSDAIKQKLVIDFEDYGVSLIQFFISTVVRPEDDPGYRRVKDLMQHRHTDIFEAQTKQQVDLIKQQTESQMRIMEAQSIAEKRRLEGYTYQDERSFDVAEKVAQNENVGQFTSMGMGIGMMAGVGGVMGGTVGNMVGNAMNSIPTPNAYAQPPAPQQAPEVTVEMPSAPQPVPQKAEPEAPTEVQQDAPQEVAQEPQAASQPAQTATSETKTFKFCPMCGTQAIPGASFCMNCGTKLIMGGN